MKTLRNLLLAGLLAAVCLAPAVSTDVSRAMSGRPLALAVHDFATAKILSSEDRSGMAAALPRVLVGLLSPALSQQAGRH